MFREVISDSYKIREFIPGSVQASVILFAVWVGIVHMSSVCGWRGWWCKGAMKIWMAVYVFAVIFYVTILLNICLFSRVPESGHQLELVLGESIADPSGYHEYIDNIILFIPFGMMAFIPAKKLTKKILLSIPAALFFCTATGLCTSLMIETSQLISKLGFFQVDDLVANTLGTLMGGCVSGIGMWVYNCVQCVKENSKGENRHREFK